MLNYIESGYIECEIARQLQIPDTHPFKSDVVEISHKLQDKLEAIDGQVMITKHIVSQLIHEYLDLNQQQIIERKRKREMELMMELGARVVGDLLVIDGSKKKII